MTDSYNQKTINMQPEQGVKTYIFDPNSTSATDVIFNNWTSLLSVLGSVTGEKVILVTSTGGSIPAGTYDMTDITIAGLDPIRSGLTIDDAVLNNLSGIKNVTLAVGSAVANTVSNFQISTATSMTIEAAVLAVGPLATAPMFDVTANALSVVNRHASYISTNAGIPVMTAAGGASIGLAPLAGAGSNSYGGNSGNSPFATGAGTISIAVGAGDIFFTADNPVVIVTLLEDYDAAGAVGVVWVGAQPTSQQTALDRIAVAVSSGAVGVPIA